MNSPIVFDIVTENLPPGCERMFSARLGLANLSAPFSFDATKQPSTMYVASIRAAARARPVVLVGDLDGLCLRNTGVSATNAAERVIGEIGPLVAQLHGCDVADLDWVAIDSEGHFDRWWVAQGVPEFQPLLAPPGSEAANRSKDAFKDSYPHAGHALFLQLLKMVVTDPCHEARSAAQDH